MGGRIIHLAYYEVISGIQTHHFEPNCYIDIGSTWRVKRAAVYRHVSQRPDRFYPYHRRWRSSGPRKPITSAPKPSFW